MKTLAYSGILRGVFTPSAGSDEYKTSAPGRPGAGPAYVLIAATLWGTVGTAQAFAPAEASPLAVGALRLVIGSLALLLAAGTSGAFRDRKPWDYRLVLAGGLGIAGFQICYFYGVALTGVALGTVVEIGCVPVIAGLLGAVILRERLTARWGLATMLSVAGCAILVLAGSRGSMDIHLGGLILCAGAGAAYAFYAIITKMLLNDHPVDGVTAVLFTVGAVILMPVLFFCDLSWLKNPHGVLVVAHLGLVATGAAYMCFVRGLSMVTAGTAATLSLAEVMVAGLLGTFLLGEKLAGPSFLGIVFILAGIVIITRPVRPARRSGTVR